MPQYNYRAVDSIGKPVTGSLNARDIPDAKQKLADTGMTVVKLKEGSEVLGKLNRLTYRKPGLKAVAEFCRQLCIIVNSGINILNGLDVLRHQTGSSIMKRTVARIYSEVQKGKTLSEAMGDEEAMLPPLLINMVSVGEMSGNLDEILRRMSIYYERENYIRHKLVTAMIYPIMLIVIAIVMMLFFMFFVLPEIISIIMESGGELPVVTRLVIGMVSFIKKYSLITIAVIVGAFALIKAVAPKDKYRMTRDKAIMHIPVIKNAIRNVVTSRFMRTMSIMVRGGIPLLQTLDSCEKVMKNAIVEEGIRYAGEKVKRGERLGENLAACGFFDPLVVHMVSIGEETGGLDNILDMMADYYDKEAETGLSRVMAAIEPVFTIIIGIFIGFIIISIMLPLFGMISQINL